MSVSIIIATYGDRWWEELALERAFPSAHDQGAHEIIVGHDDHLSIGPVRNVLAEKASGDWLCFLDADDELAPGYIEAMEHSIFPARLTNAMTVAIEDVEEAVRKPLLLTPRVQQIIGGRRRPPRFYPEVNLLSGNWLIVGTLIERELFEKVGGFGDYPHGFEDWSLWYKATKLGAEVVRVKDAVYVQHVNPKSKHRMGWRDRKYQVSTHISVQKELEAWKS